MGDKRGVREVSRSAYQFRPSRHLYQGACPVRLERRAGSLRPYRDAQLMGLLAEHR